MKKALFLLLSLSIFSCFGEKDEPRPNGAIKTKTVSEYTCEEKFGECVPLFSGKQIQKFDSDGNMVEMSIYNADLELVAKRTYKYDSNGNKVEESKYDSDSELQSKQIYKYDSTGNEIEWSEYKPDGELIKKNITKYDSNNNPIEIVKYRCELKFGEVQEIPVGNTIMEYEYY